MQNKQCITISRDKEKAESIRTADQTLLSAKSIEIGSISNKKTEKSKGSKKKRNTMEPL